MTKTPLLVGVLSLAATAAGQSPMPLPGYGSTWAGNQARGFYFQCPVACIITGLEVPNEQNQPLQTVAVVDFGGTPPPQDGGSTTPVVGTQLFYDNTTPADTLISTSIPLVAGNWYGVLGACYAPQNPSIVHTSYPRAQSSGPFVSDILGNAVTIARLQTSFTLSTNQGSPPCTANDTGWVGRVEVHIDSPECFFLLGLQSTNLQFGGETFLVEPLLVLPMDLATLPSFDVPANNNLIGLPIYGQSVMYNPTVFPHDPIRVSQGIEFNIGNHTTPYGLPSGLLMWPTSSPVVQPGGQISIGFTFQ